MGASPDDGAALSPYAPVTVPAGLCPHPGGDLAAREGLNSESGLPGRYPALEPATRANLCIGCRFW